MRRCPACHDEIDSGGWSCPGCGFRAQVRNGFTALAPALDGTSTGFGMESFALLADLEERHFWFRSRNRLIRAAIARHFGRPGRITRIMEIGCGTGMVLGALAAALPDAHLVGSELHTDGLAIARARLGDRVELLQMDARRMPFADEFDVIGAFDVLEHIAEDEAVLAEMHRAVRPGGGIILSVPQHPSLWSRADTFAHHERRYRRGELATKVRRAGFEVVRSTSFVTLLLPLMAVSRWRDRENADYDPTAEMRVGNLTNTVLGGALAFERGVIACGIDLPVGGSRLVVARKPG